MAKCPICGTKLDIIEDGVYDSCPRCEPRGYTFERKDYGVPDELEERIDELEDGTDG